MSEHTLIAACKIEMGTETEFDNPIDDYWFATSAVTTNQIGCPTGAGYLRLSKAKRPNAQQGIS